VIAQRDEGITPYKAVLTATSLKQAKGVLRMDKVINFEQNIKELEEVVRQLEGGDVSLDELLALFEKGVGLAKVANLQLDNAEQNINMLIKNKVTGDMEEIPMDGAADSVGDTNDIGARVARPSSEDKAFVEKTISEDFAEVAEEVPPIPTDIPPKTPQQAMIGFDDLV